MASLTFGAVGDIIAIANIVVHVVKALSRTRGAAGEYQGLTNELKVLVHALESIESLLRQASSDDASLLELQEKLQLALDSCRNRLERELDNLRKFEHSLAKVGPIKSAQDAFWRLRWPLQKREITIFRQSISNHTSAITLFFHQYALQLSQDNHKIMLDQIRRLLTGPTAGRGARLSRCTGIYSSLSRICVEPADDYGAIKAMQPIGSGIPVEAVAKLPLDTTINASDNYRFHETSFTSLLQKKAQKSSKLRTRSCPDFLVRMGGAPTSLFECLPSFYPETYTNQDPVPTIFGYHNLQVGETEYMRVFQSALFYRKARRHWMRVTACITVSIESAFWNLETADSFNPKVALVLPRYVLSVLGDFLRTCHGCEQDSHLSLFLGSQSKSDKQGLFAPRVKLIKPPFKAKEYLQQISNTVRHWQCPRYSQEHLIHRPLSRRRANHSFLAYTGSRWLREYRFGSSQEQIDTNLYMLRILHYLQGMPGIIPFQGIVLDEDGHTINAFLCDLPAMGKLANIIGDAERSGEPISWQRREKWCRQIVQAVKHVHDREFVIGSLGETPDGAVAIDGADDAVLYRRFQKIFRYDGVRAGILPPEFRRRATSIEGSFNACPESDIYQLGLLLWRIVMQKLVLLRSECCHNAGCIESMSTFCTEPHADPPELPPLSEEVPQYLKNVIAACRIADPAERLTARELLEMFPPEGKQDTSMKSTPKQLLQLEDILEKFDCTVTCDRCGERTSSHFFHCEICASTDYDLCPPCFSKGEHCLEEDHMLREYREGPEEEKYYTSVKENGRRDVVIR